MALTAHDSTMKGRGPPTGLRPPRPPPPLDRRLLVPRVRNPPHGRAHRRHDHHDQPVRDTRSRSISDQPETSHHVRGSEPEKLPSQVAVVRWPAGVGVAALVAPVAPAPMKQLSLGPHGQVGTAKPVSGHNARQDGVARRSRNHKVSRVLQHEEGSWNQKGSSTTRIPQGGRHSPGRRWPCPVGVDDKIPSGLHPGIGVRVAGDVDRGEGSPARALFNDEVPVGGLHHQPELPVGRVQRLVRAQLCAG